MSANPIDLFTARTSATETAIIESAFRPERRRRPRTQVHWPVLLVPHRGEGAIETVTQNLSSSGFYCVSSCSFAPGESLLCTLQVPVFDPKSEELTLALECRIAVLRTESIADGFYGIACRIDDYRLLTGGLRTA